MPAKVRHEDRDRTWRYVDGAIALYEPDFSLKDQNIERFSEYVYALANLINIDGLKINNNLKRGIIEVSMKKFRYSGELSLETFLDQVEQEYKIYLKKPRKKYFVIFPINIKYTSLKKSWFSILDTKIMAYSFNHIANNFDFEQPLLKLKQDPVLKNQPFTKFTYFLIEEYAINWKHALDSAYKKIELLRAIINYAGHAGSVIYQSGKPKPISLVQPSQMSFVFEGRTCKYGGAIVGYFDQNIVDLNSFPHENLIKKTELILKMIDSIKNRKLKHRILKMIDLYNDSLDAYTTKGYSFIHLWQICELIAQTSGKEICNRLLSFFKEEEPYKDIIEALYEKRNLLVHEGELLEFASDDINKISGICYNLILVLLSNTTKFENIEGIEYYYENKKMHLKNLKMKRRIIDLILKQKL